MVARRDARMVEMPDQADPSPSERAPASAPLAVLAVVCVEVLRRQTGP